MDGLERIHGARGILVCCDFFATPFIPSGRRSSEEALFGWIVSDFGLGDAIESGLVKTPRVVICDDAVPGAKTYKSRRYRNYQIPEVKDDLDRRAKPEDPLQDLVTNGCHLLDYDWRKTARAATATRTEPSDSTSPNRSSQSTSTAGSDAGVGMSRCIPAKSTELSHATLRLTADRARRARAE